MRLVVRALGWFCAVGLVLLTLFAGALAYLTVNLEQHRSLVESTVSDALGRPVRVGTLDLGWDEGIPLLAIGDLEILDDGGEVTAGFRSAELHLDLVSTLRAHALISRQIRIIGARISVHRDAAGSVRISGLGRRDPSPGGMRSARQLLLGPARVSFSDAKLLFFDARLGGEPIELGLRIDIERQDAGQELTGLVELPGQPAQYIEVDGTLGIAASEHGWIADLNLNAEDLRLAPLVSLLPRSVLPGLDPTTTFNLRLQFSNGRLVRARGATALYGLDLLPGAPLGGPASLRGNFDYRPVERGWELDVNHLDVAGARRQWQAEAARMVFMLGDGGQPGSYRAQLTEARIEDVVSMLAFLEPDSDDVEELRALQVTGNTRDLTATWMDVGGDEVPFTAAFSFDDVGWPERRDENWGLNGIAGHASVSLAGGTIRLHSDTPVIVTSSEVFAKPVTFNGASGQIEVRRKASAIEFHSEEVLFAGSSYDVALSGSVTVDADPSALLHLTVTIDAVEFADAGKLLPSPLFPDGLNTWFQRSIQSGSMRNVSLGLDGRIRDLTVSGKTANVSLQGTLQNGVLAYADGWPTLTEVDGPLVLRGGKLTATTPSASLNGLPVSVSATLPDVGAEDGRLLLELKTSSDLKNVRKTFNATPLARNIPKPLRQVDARGPVNLTAEVSMTADGRILDTRTNIDMNGATIRASKQLAPVSKLRGRLILEGDELKSRNMSGQWLGQPVSLALDGKTTGGGQLTVASDVGPNTLIRLAELAELERPAWLERVRGASRWKLTMKAERDQRVSFIVNTDLAGTALHMPAPLGKPSDSSRALRIEGELSPELLRIAARYGPLSLSGVGSRGKRRNIGYHLQLNGAAPAARLGDRRIRGKLELLDIDAWVALLGPDTDAARISMPDVEIKIDSVRFAGIAFPNTGVRVDREQRDASTVVLLNGPAVAGRVIPPSQSQQLLVDLDHLVIPHANTTSGERTDPRTLPDFNFLTKKLIYGDVDLGSLKIAAKSVPDGLAFESIYLISPLFDLSGTGGWVLRDGKQSSVFKVAMHADQMGDLLKAAGVKGDTATGGTTSIDAHFAWPGTPGDITERSLYGEMTFQASSGRILSIDTGASGKVFALLNLNALPQILSLDLGRLFETGLEFDRIHGVFTLDGGNAYTNNLTVSSKSAEITIAGRTGLAVEDYDQIVTVRPSVSGSLPVAGAAFGGVGAGVGAAIWLAEKLLNTKIIDKIASFRYRVSGDWEQPVIERENLPAEQETGQAGDQ